MFILTFVCYFMQKIAMKAELERKGMPLKRSKNLLQIYLFFMVQYFQVNPGLLYSSLTFTTWQKQSSLIVLCKV